MWSNIYDNNMEDKEKIKLIKSLSQVPISDDEASLAYENLVRLFVALYKTQKEINNVS